MARIVGMITRPIVVRDTKPQSSKVDYDSLKKDDLKKLLDEKGIEYDNRATNEQLIKLLEGAE